MDDVEVAGLRIAYERRGAGPAVVLLQGFVGDGCATWSRQLDDLSGDFTVVAWDPPGLGGSDDPPPSFRSPDFADCLAGFVTALGLDRPHVVGLSFGGVLALELVARHPEVPRSLVLAGAYAGWPGSLGRQATAERLDSCLRAAELPAEEFVAAMLPSMFADPAAEYATTFGASMGRAFSPAGFRAMARACAEADLRPGLGHVQVPTLLLHGEHDVRAPRPVADALHDAIPGSRLLVIPGAGHVSCVERPARFSRAVRDVLLTT